MIAVDTNILVYAHREDSPFHAAAFGRVAQLAEGPATWAIPWPCLREFISIVAYRRSYAAPTPLPRALDQVDAWMESPTLTLLAKSTAHWPTLRALLVAGRVAGALVHDARVAALCRQHGMRELWSADRDFGRFAGLTVVNPLMGKPTGEYRDRDCASFPLARHFPQYRRETGLRPSAPLTHQTPRAPDPDRRTL